jgi:hypothetical protein
MYLISNQFFASDCPLVFEVGRLRTAKQVIIIIRQDFFYKAPLQPEGRFQSHAINSLMLIL